MWGLLVWVALVKNLCVNFETFTWQVALGKATLPNPDLVYSQCSAGSVGVAIKDSDPPDIRVFCIFAFYPYPSFSLYLSIGQSSFSATPAETSSWWGQAQKPEDTFPTLILHLVLFHSELFCNIRILLSPGPCGPGHPRPTHQIKGPWGNLLPSLRPVLQEKSLRSKVSCSY